MPEVGVKELLQAGVHFGHQTRRWHPKMRRYIFGEREGIHIIDLMQTVELLEQARAFTQDLTSRGGIILFVGTKKQAKDVVREVSEQAGMPYVNQRWLGGLLTNYNTIRKRIQRLHDLRRLDTEGHLALLPTKERMSMQAELLKLETNLGGVAGMERLPDAMFVADLKVEELGVKEANRLDVETIGLVDTNCDPEMVDQVIPGNDDAIRSCDLVIRTIGDAAAAGRAAFTRQEEQARKEAEEQARAEAEQAAAAAAGEGGETAQPPAQPQQTQSPPSRVQQ